MHRHLHTKHIIIKMRSPRRTSIAASVIATAVALPITSIVAFQTGYTATQISTHHIRRRTSCLNTASKESTEIVNTDDDDNFDEEYAADDSWTLRQITFLGLTKDPAAHENDVETSGDEEDEEPKNVLDARNLSEFLMEIGACSVSITDFDKDTENEDPLFGDLTLDDEELNEQWAMVIPDWAAGRNLWKKCDVSAHFPSSFDVSSIVDSVRYTFDCPTQPRYKVDDVPDLDWVLHVQESWHPIVTRNSKFVLRFPWHEDSVVMKACQTMEMEKMEVSMKKQFSSGVMREGAVVHFEEDDGDDTRASSDAIKENREYVQIELEGGIAFGTGEHPTTRMCMDWVRDKVETRLDHSNDDNSEKLQFMDYGAGSGVLGIAAAAVVRDYNKQSKKKAGITTIGVEIDADAIHIANDNAKKNHVDMKNYLPDPDSLDAEALSVVLKAMQRKLNVGVIKTLPEDLNGPVYDLCAANILAAPLVGLAPTIASLVKSGGEIGLSGVLATQAESVVEAYSELFDNVKVAVEDGGWVLITGKRR